MRKVLFIVFNLMIILCQSSFAGDMIIDLPTRVDKELEFRLEDKYELGTYIVYRGLFGYENSNNTSNPSKTFILEDTYWMKISRQSKLYNYFIANSTLSPSAIVNYFSDFIAGDLNDAHGFRLKDNSGNGWGYYMFRSGSFGDYYVCVIAPNLGRRPIEYWDKMPSMVSRILK